MAERLASQSGPTADRPIFIVGAGRSGSTVFHRMFCEHPDVAWQSPLCDLFPASPGWNRALLSVARRPWLGPWLTRYLRPGERYKFWEHFCRGFSRPCRDLTRADVTPMHRQAIPPAVARLATPSRRRVLIKITGWPRVGFLRELFPQAKFIHVYRDGRAVASSLLAVRFWRGWEGPAGWGFGALDPAEQDEWERHDRSFVALAGIQWKLLMAAMDATSADVPASDLMHLRYEDFIDAPVAAFKRVTEFCGLDWSSPFGNSIRQKRLKTANEKWKQQLTPEQQAVLESVLATSLRQYGYSSRC
ncbi:MAG TPA: sulfotransferase [Rhodanobacteraceae bacterium]|nr:sulfotransferase [Rhodanobacteraceae bacterium]